jgi:2'-5' RNA ligase
VFEFIDAFARSDGLSGRRNLFFALCPSPAEAMHIQRLGLRLRAETGFSGSVTAAERLHVSLHGLGEHHVLSKHLVDAACDAGDRLRFPRFVVTFDSAGSFLGGRSGKWPFVLRSVHDIDALTLFHRALASAMTRSRLRHMVAAQFTPHMTLLYDHRFERLRKVEAVCFAVRELVLISSLTGQGRHVRIGRWPLRG